MKIKLVRCGICKHWHGLPVDMRNVHCPVCGSARVYFKHWNATYFNEKGVEVKRAHNAGLLGLTTR